MFIDIILFGGTMNIFICGCGKIGRTVIAGLCAEGHDVVAIDNKSTVIEELTNTYDIMGICGNGADCETLQEAGIEKADLFGAFTDSDELNMLSCFFAKSMGAKHTIARIRNPEYNDQSLGFMRQQLGLSMSINPEHTLAQDIFNVLKLPSAVKIEHFSRRNFEMVELILAPDSDLCGMKLYKIREKYRASFLICAVQRGEDIFIPGGQFELMAGDKIALTASPSEMGKLLKMLNLIKRRARSVIILGGGKTAYYLAKMLSALGGTSVRIIEKNEALCNELSAELPDAVIIHGDGTHRDVLLEEGIKHADAFVSLSSMDEENILSSIFASSVNVPKTITKVSRDELLPMAARLGLETIVSPSDAASGSILGFVRALENTDGSNIETLYKLMDGKAEALEFSVAEIPGLTKIPLKSLKFKKNMLIAGIIRGRRAIIPSGDDMIMPGDRVVVLTADHKLYDLTDTLA